ncbi:MAG: hypothetical protein QOD81_4472, partial [Solirubrobacteraceae bacterium]|nr:hypothetical protein [Solirubrobacteraceae bacterium]
IRRRIPAVTVLSDEGPVGAPVSIA